MIVVDKATNLQESEHGINKNFVCRTQGRMIWSPSGDRLLRELGGFQ